MTENDSYVESGLRYRSFLPVTKKYESKMKVKIVHGEGVVIHEGFLIFKSGTVRMLKIGFKTNSIII